MTTMEHSPPRPDRMRLARVRTATSRAEVVAVQRIAEALRRQGVLTATAVLDRLNRGETARFDSGRTRTAVADISDTDIGDELPWRAA
jgi:hypothetical protein